MSFKKPSLRLSLILYVLVPLLLAMGTLSYIALRAFEQQVEDRMEEDVELVARAIRYPLGQALALNREGSLKEALESAFSINRVYGAYVYNNEGMPIASIGRYNTSQDKERLQEITLEGDRQGEYQKIGGREVYSYFVPLTSSGGRTVGLLQITRRASDIRESIDRLRRYAGGFMLVTFLLMAGLVLYGHRRAIGKYLNRLSESMSTVKRGNRDHRASLDGPREIANLGQVLNSMLDSIAAAEEEIRQRRAEQLALEKQLKHAEKLAAIGQLSAGVAHELGTPLSVIDGKAQQVLRRDDLPEPLHAAFEDVRGQVQRMEHIIRQLLDFGRRHNVERRPVSADKIIQMVCSALQMKSRELDVDLQLSGPEPPPTLSVDPTLMERALTNLLRNAIEATPGGKVELSWFRDGETVGFTVSDNGPGIDDEHKKRLFEPFFTTKDIGEGTGLGLAVVHGIVEEHGGTIKIQDSEHGGAQFRIVLPHSSESSRISTSEVQPQYDNR